MTGWEELASTALLGTARRTLAVDRLPAPLRAAEENASVQLLDVAALATAYRRAGMPLGPRRELPGPAPLDDRPVVPMDARNRLSQLLTLHDSDLLGQWLRVAAQRRLVPPPRALPRLLKETVRPELAPDVVAATGPRGIWLAGFQPHWRTGVAVAAGLVNVPPSRWADASDAERRQWLVGLGRTKPDEVRGLLEHDSSSLLRSAGPELVTVLRQALSPEQEPFLETCLDDRRAEVRAAAAGMLQLLPESAYLARVTARAQAAVKVEGRQLVVSAPEAYDERLRRDGIPRPPKPPSQVGPDEWLVMHVVGAAPLRAWAPWATRIGELAGLLPEGRWSSILWYGWARATKRERDVAWAAALVRCEVARAADLAQLLSAFPAPWPEQLAVTVLDWLEAHGEFPYEIRTVLDLAAHRLPVEAIERMRTAARGWPPDSPARNAFVRAVELMAYRRAMFEELQ